MAGFSLAHGYHWEGIWHQLIKGLTSSWQSVAETWLIIFWELFPASIASSILMGEGIGEW